MVKIKKIGITGGISSGKSTVSNYLKQLNFIVIDSDKISHEILNTNSKAIRQVIEVFGSKYQKEDGTIDRKALGKEVFNDSCQLEKLEEITHPIVFSEIEKRVLEYENMGKKLVFIDMPLLYEVGYNKVDDVWLVYVDEETQIERLMKRDNLTLEEAKTRLSCQMSLEEKKTYNNRVIDNTGSIIKTQEQVDKLLRSL